MISQLKHIPLFLAGMAALGGAPSVVAAPIPTTFDEFGELSEATFGGSGIPNDPVAISRLTRTDSLGLATNITLGLGAHGRFSNTLIGDDGAGTYFAKAGSNIPTGTTIEGATWNFNIFMDIEGGSLGEFVLQLFYDFDPASGTDESDHGIINFNLGIDANPDPNVTPINTSRVESSQNLLFDFLADGTVPGITPPPGSFDPDVAGEYSFALVLSEGIASDQQTLTEVTRSAIHVEVQTAQAVPEPTSLALLGLGLAGLGYSRRRALSPKAVD